LRWAVAASASLLFQLALREGVPFCVERAASGWEAAALLLEAAGVWAPVGLAAEGSCGAALAVNTALAVAGRVLGL
ncbi:MAG: hypothetical protein GXO15_00870, partial [Crenarchaeota archaeon]|nr:hypothetical protein [Thermoproteota archaeon]